jgi:hypothetical protein
MLEIFMKDWNLSGVSTIRASTDTMAHPAVAGMNHGRR